jgi:hypothetical protein
VSSTAKQQLSRNPQNAGYSNPIKTYPVPAVTNEDGTISVPAQPVYGIDPNHEPIDMYLAVRSIPGGTPAVLVIDNSGITAGGLNTIGTWAATVKRNLLGVTIDVVCTATVGNRTIGARLLDAAGNILWVGSTSAATTAGQTCGYDVVFGMNGTPSTAVRRNLLNTGNTNVQVREFCPMSQLVGGANVSLVIDDYANVDNADAVYSRSNYQEYTL